jgi:hypothetical protein
LDDLVLTAIVLVVVAYAGVVLWFVLGEEK